MASVNATRKNTFKEKTHGGVAAARMTTVEALRRSVMSCMLFEGEFYENGKTIADRISTLAAEVPIETLANIAIEAREVANLRHVPLLLCVALAKRGSGHGDRLVANTIARVIQRADELAEFVALYWKMNPSAKQGKQSALSKQVKLGLGAAFSKFDAYQIAKYDRAKEVRLRDVLFLVHPKASPEVQAVLNALAAQTLESPDTWEVALSAGGDKKTEFTRLLTEKKLGYLALLRNLRNMATAGVDRELVNAAIVARKGGAERVLPFRFIAAARAAPQFEPALDTALIASLEGMPKLTGKTLVLVDVSDSMNARISAKSDLMRIDAAAAIAAVIPADDLRVMTFSNGVVEVPARKGMAGVDVIIKSQRHAGTALAATIKVINEQVEYDRLIVITDEQANGGSSFSMNKPNNIPAPKSKLAYMVNVASNKNGVGYGRWTHIDGFSEQVIRWIIEAEKAELIGVSLVGDTGYTAD